LNKGEIELVDLNSLENFDREGIMSRLKFYQKIIRYLFNKYSASGYTHKNKKTFERRKLIDDSVNIPEVWKFIKDHDF
jgi:hypothetical protein